MFKVDVYFNTALDETVEYHFSDYFFPGNQNVCTQKLDTPIHSSSSLVNNKLQRQNYKDVLC